MLREKSAPYNAQVECKTTAVTKQKGNIEDTQKRPANKSRCLILLFQVSPSRGLHQGWAMTIHACDKREICIIGKCNCRLTRDGLETVHASYRSFNVNKR